MNFLRKTILFYLFTANPWQHSWQCPLNLVAYFLKEESWSGKIGEGHSWEYLELLDTDGHALFVFTFVLFNKTRRTSCYRVIFRSLTLYRAFADFFLPPNWSRLFLKLYQLCAGSVVCVRMVSPFIPLLASTPHITLSSSHVPASTSLPSPWIVRIRAIRY